LSNSNGHVPSHWRGDFSQTSSIPRALEVLGDSVPKSWAKASAEAHQAEWKCRATYPDYFSPTLSQNRDSCVGVLAEAEARLANAATPGQKKDLANFVENCRHLLAAAQEILEACPAESERLKIRADREQRKFALSRLKEQRTQYELRKLPVPLEVIEALLDLAETVEVDEREIAKEQRQREFLQQEASDLKAKAIGILVDEIAEQIFKTAQTVRAPLGPRGVAISKVYPRMSDPRIMDAFDRAHSLAKVAADLNGAKIDVDATFGNVLSQEQYAAFSAVVWAHSASRRDQK